VNVVPQTLRSEESRLLPPSWMSKLSTSATTFARAMSMMTVCVENECCA
jgi:predicted nuclease with RNAse H fold